MQYLVPILIGLAAGTSGGLFGIGGGIVIVPLLTFALGFSQQRAQGTSLAVLVFPVAAAAVWNYYQKGHVDFRTGFFVALGFMAGSYLGSKVAVGLDPATMRRVFSVFLMLVAVHMFVSKDPKPTKSSGAEQSAPDRR